MSIISRFRISDDIIFKRYIIEFNPVTDKYIWICWINGVDAGEIMEHTGDVTISDGKLILHNWNCCKHENNFSLWNDVDKYINTLPFIKGISLILMDVINDI